MRQRKKSLFQMALTLPLSNLCHTESPQNNRCQNFSTNNTALKILGAPGKSKQLSPTSCDWAMQTKQVRKDRIMFIKWRHQGPYSGKFALTPGKSLVRLLKNPHQWQTPAPHHSLVRPHHSLKTYCALSSILPPSNKRSQLPHWQPTPVSVKEGMTWEPIEDAKARNRKGYEFSSGKFSGTESVLYSAESGEVRDIIARRYRHSIVIYTPTNTKPPCLTKCLPKRHHGGLCQTVTLIQLSINSLSTPDKRQSSQYPRLFKRILV